MSAIGTTWTFRDRRLMSAIGGKLDIAHVPAKQIENPKGGVDAPVRSPRIKCAELVKNTRTSNEYKREKQMRRHFSRAAVLIVGLAMLFMAAGARADWTTLAPAEGGFSVVCPGVAKRQNANDNGVTSRLWLVTSTNLLCVTGNSDYSGHIANAARELTADMNNFLKGVKGRALSQKRLTFAKAPDGPLPALDFTFVYDGGKGKSLVVVSGDRSYQVVAIALNGYEGKADIARIIQSFRIMVPAWHP